VESRTSCRLFGSALRAFVKPVFVVASLATVLLALASAKVAAQSSVVYYRAPSISGAGDACVNGPVYGESPTAVAQLKVAQNNSLTGPTCGATCFDPVDLLEVTESSYTVQSICNGAQFTHPILKIINPKQPPEDCCVGNPVNPAYGAKYQEEVDFPGTAAGELKLVRFYNSARDPEKASGFGDSWTHGYLRRLAVILTSSGSPIPYEAVFARRPNGQIFVFKRISGVWQPDADVNASLVEVLDQQNQVTGRRLTVGDRQEVESYDLVGRLTSIQERTGRTQTLTYSDGTGGANGGFLLDANGNPTTTVIPQGTLIRITDSGGRVMQFGYDMPVRISKIVDPMGWVYRYQYGANNNLMTVTYPDLRTRQYVYNEPANTSGANLPRALTGIIDENNVRYATYKYDPQGRAVSTEHANGVDSYVLSYSLDASGNPVSTSVTDARGTTRNYSFASAVGAVKQTGLDQPGASSFQAQTHDANGNVASRTDWNGNRTNYAYDLARNLETSRTEGLTSAGGTTPQTRTISTQWHPAFRLPTGIAEPLRITSFVYDPDGAQCGAKSALCSKTVVATTDADGSQGFGAMPSGTARTSTYTYNADGLVLSANGPRTDVSDVTTYTYYANSASCPTANGGHPVGCRGRPATVTNALGHMMSITAYNGNGHPKRIDSPTGLVTEILYNWRQQPVSRSVGGELTSYEYGPTGQLAKVTLPDGSFLSYGYDSAHRLTQIQDNLGNRIVYTLDATGNRTLEEVRDPANALMQKRSRVYNSLNRLFQELGAQSQTTEYVYDNQGNVISVKDPLLRVTSNQYDTLNRLVQVTDPALGITQYGYNGQGRLTSVSDPRSLTTSYVVDGLSNLTQQVSPDTGTTANTYDAAGNLLTQTDAKGQTTTYAYDALNRVTLITFHDGSKQSYAYDSGTNAIGKLSSITESNAANQVTSVISYAYNLHGRVTSETRTVNGVAYAIGYTYDASGRLSARVMPSGRTVSYAYDGVGRLSAVSTTPPGGAAEFLASNVTYHPFGGVKGYTLGNGQVYTRSIDLDGRISSYTLGSRTFALGYDAASRIEFISDTAVPANSNSYAYDALDRLTGATTPATPYAYSYDAVGNRLSRTAGSSTDAYAYGSASNRISSIQTPSGLRSFVFDANGSTTADGSNTYAYDVRGRMVQATSSAGTTSYQVNALGQRIRKTNSAGDKVFVYDTAGRLLNELTSAGTPTRGYFYLGDIPLATIVSGGTMRYIHVDHLNTPRLITDATGTAVWNWDQQEPFGNNVPDENPSGLGAFEFPLRFPGQYFDRETNLAYNYFRSYDHGIGRYVESDPIGLQGGLNTYAYVDLDPLKYADPEGLRGPGGAKAVEALVTIVGGLIAGKAAQDAGQAGGNSAQSGGQASNANCPTCDKDYALYVKCSDLYDYPYWSAYDALASIGGGRLHNRNVATKGPCSVDSGMVPGKHWNIRAGSTRRGSLVMCPCCEDRPSGAVLREKYAVIP
jgi:RHS repeat-associated protein